MKNDKIFPIFGAGSVFDPDAPVNKKARKELQSSDVDSLAIFAQHLHGLSSDQVKELREKALGLKKTKELPVNDMTTILRKAVLKQLEELQSEAPIPALSWPDALAALRKELTKK